jgi:hypothetical protein
MPNSGSLLIAKHRMESFHTQNLEQSHYVQIGSGTKHYLSPSV